MLTDELRAAGWKPHDGGPCPVPGETLVSLLLRNGDRFRCGSRAKRLAWEHDGDPYDIIAYKENPHAI